MSYKEKYFKYKSKYLGLNILKKVRLFIRHHIKDASLRTLNIINNDDNNLLEYGEIVDMFKGKGDNVLINLFPKKNDKFYENITNYIKKYEWVILLINVKNMSDINFNKMLSLPAYRQFYYVYYGIIYLIISEKSHIEIPEFKLLDVNNKEVSNMSREKKEQQYLKSILDQDDIVLQLGGNIGTSCILVDKLTNGKNVCVEPNKKLISTLEKNKKKNNSRFDIIFGTISKKTQKLVTTENDDNLANYVVDENSNLKGENVNNYDFHELNKKYKFNVLFADCEGCITSFLKDYPESLKYFKKIVFEIDYIFYVDYKPVFQTLAEYGFVYIDGYLNQIFMHHSILKEKKFTHFKSLKN
jgi:FkbM family methyltransferase